MKLKRIVSLSLLSTIFFNSTISFGGTLSDDRRYEIFNENNISISDILEDDTAPIKIEGNTLVNYLDYNTIQANNYASINRENKEIIFDNRVTDDSVSFTDVSIFLEPSLKASGTYTLVFEILENTITSNQTFGALDSAWEYIPKEWVKLEPGTTGLIKIPFSVKENNNGRMKMYLRNPVDDTNRGIMKIKNLMILEGDWSNKIIPDYFEGVQSSFEDQLITQGMIDTGQEKKENLGKYKVEVKSTGKNLFNVSTWKKNDTIANKNRIELTWNEDSITIKALMHDGYMSTGVHQKNSILPLESRQFLIKVKPNTQYTISYNKESNTSAMSSYINLINSRFLATDLINIGGGTTTFTTNSDTAYITMRFGVVGVGNYATFSNIQLEEGFVATSYEQYKQSLNTFYLNSPLLEGDTLEYINGSVNHIHRYKQVEFDGSDDEKWKNWNSTSTVITSKFGITIKDASKPSFYNLNNDRICNKFNTTLTPYNFSLSDIEGINTWDHDISIAIGINKSKLATDDINGFKKWLSKNPITVVYRLAEPIYEPIKGNLSIDLFKGTTYISNNSNIPTNIEVVVDRVLNRALEAIESAKLNPTTENIALARMWTNLVKDSSKKDELQSDINEITDILDLQIDKKSATANLDVYIKSENALSMSLSTNYVVFEGYNGTEDLEKLNALDITVSSSLPYDLNAYLEGNLQNSDGSSIISPTALNIKENSNANYNQFINTQDKVVLNSDCNAGNNNLHSIDLKIESDNTYKADIYKTTIKFEAVQK